LSSAQQWYEKVYSLKMAYKGIMCNENKTGPSIEPCGTPYKTDAKDDK